MDIKNNLREIRMREFAEDPKEFSKRINVNIKTYYTWENGLCNPSSKEMLRIAKVLNMPVESIWWLE